MNTKAFPEVKLINSSLGVVIGRAGDLLLVHISSGLNSHRVLVLETQLEGHPDLSSVPELSLGILKTYMV